MANKYLKGLFIIFNIGVLLIPLAIGFMALSSIFSPDKRHSNLLRESTAGTPIWVGYQGGAQVCKNDLCTIESGSKKYSYLVWPDSVSSGKFYNVVYLAGQNIEIQAYAQDTYTWILFMVLMLAYGMIMNYRMWKQAIARNDPYAGY